MIHDTSLLETAIRLKQEYGNDPNSTNLLRDLPNFLLIVNHSQNLINLTHNGGIVA
jgi:hypothetical protein